MDRGNVIHDVITAFEDWEENRRCPGEDWSDVHQSMDIVVSLLKAQEPVEPVFTAMIETDMSYWTCGACGAFVYGSAYPHMLEENRPKYCGYCGRAVKWE